jgi:AcrR family transcriptional regulator
VARDSRQPKPRPDPTRGLTLLWGAQDHAGRSGLTLGAIATAAIEIADQDGYEAVAMRAVAQRLQAGAMTLYTHVPGKAELIDLMIDRAYGELYRDVDEPARQSPDWRQGLRFIAERNWDLYQRHPWLLDIAGRPTLGPNASDKYEAELRPLDGIGLTDLEMDSVLTLVLSHVEATARAQMNMVHSQRESGVTDLEWWIAIAPTLARLSEGKELPVASRVGQAAGMAHQAASNPVHAFSFGLERILGGVAMLLDRREEGDRGVDG